MKTRVHIVYMTEMTRFLIVVTILLLLSIITLLLSPCFGSYPIPLEIVAEAIIGGGRDVEHVIIMELRIPRTIAAYLVGASLSLSGLLLQTVFGNPLVEPYTLGVASAAMFGVVLTMTLFSNIIPISHYSLSSIAFIFAVTSMLLLYSVGRLLRFTITQMLLAGVALNILYSSLSMIIELYLMRDLHVVLFLMLGSVAPCRWVHIVFLLIATMIVLTAGIILRRQLDTLLLGEEHAMQTGVNVKVVKDLILIVIAFTVALNVSIVGIIGFIGLIVPHIARIIVSSSHARNIITSFMLGGIITALSDLIARSMIPGLDIPISIITSLYGVPFFLYLLLRSRGGSV